MSSLTEKRYFIAVLPPHNLIEEVETIKDDFALNYQSKGSKNAPAHITLHMPFLWKQEKEEKLLAELSQLQNDILQFNIELNQFSHFGDRVIYIDVVKNENLSALQKMVVDVMKHLYVFNQVEDKRGFHPHITVAFRDLKKEQFVKAWDVYKEKIFNRSFTCFSFTLLRHENKIWKEIHTFNLKHE